MSDDSEIDDLLGDFLLESREGLDRLDADFVQLEQAPHDQETLASVFRTIHTIKGTCGFLGLANLERLAHVGESLLVKLRDGETRLTGDMTSTLLDMVDAIRVLLDRIETEGDDHIDNDALIARLEAHVSGCAADRAPAEPSATDDDASAATHDTGAVTANTGPPKIGAESRKVEYDAETNAVIGDFLGESFEGLDRVSTELVELEAHPDDRHIVSSIFRTVHTIKGTCGFFDFARLEKLMHAGETLLVGLREGELSMTAEIADNLLAMVDVARELLQQIDRLGHDEGTTAEVLTIRLATLAHDSAALPAEGSTSKPIVSRSSDSSVRATAGGDQTPAVVHREPSVALDGETATPETEPESGGVTSPAASSDEQLAAPGNPSGAPAAAAVAAVAASVSSESSIRVDVPLLDALMNQVGELVLARNQILAFSDRMEDAAFTAAAQRLNLITSELQDGVMQTRMQPIHSIWAKLPRVVRDLSRAVNKQVRVEMSGKETELDKSLIEAMKDPLTHLVRNSVDHGIETPERRLAQGKAAEGVLHLGAYHEGGQVHIEIRDDGAGIDPARLCAKAVSMGLVMQSQVDAMTHTERCKLIFHAGLSTAEQVTNISGRGVGMDVVKNNIDAISGSIDLESTPGIGTTFKIRVPLTLAIVPALIVTSGGERFAIPQGNLLELIRIDSDKRGSVVEDVNGTPVMRLRGRLLPVVYLNDQLGMQGSVPDSQNIVILQTADTRFGLVVDRIDESQEIVVKPLAEALRALPVLAGATIMGDGCLALIIDVGGLAERAGLFESSTREQLGQYARETVDTLVERRSLLLVRSGRTGRVAIPLSDVARLEQFADNELEHAGGRRLVQYRGQILPLVTLGDVLHEYGDVIDAEPDNVHRVVVFGEQGRQVGLIVDEILDVVDEALTANGDSTRDGVLATAVVQQRVTELFDVQRFLADATPRLDHAA